MSHRRIEHQRCRGCPLTISCRGYRLLNWTERCFHLNNTISLPNTTKHSVIGAFSPLTAENSSPSNRISRRFEPLFDTLRGSSRDLYFTPAQRSRLVYDCLLRTPFDTTAETESEDQQGEKEDSRQSIGFLLRLVLQGTGDPRERRVLELEKIFTGSSISAGEVECLTGRVNEAKDTNDQRSVTSCATISSNQLEFFDCRRERKKKTNVGMERFLQSLHRCANSRRRLSPIRINGRAESCIMNSRVKS